MSYTEDTKGVIRIRKSKDRQNLCVLFTDRTTTPPNQPTPPLPPSPVLFTVKFEKSCR